MTTFTQAAHGSFSSASSAAQAYTSSNGAGNVLVCTIVTANASGHDVTNVTDSAGNTWTRGHTTTTVDVTSISMWYVASSLAGANTVTVHFSTSVSTILVGLTEHHPAVPFAFDKSGVATGASGFIGPTLTPLAAGELAIAAVCSEGDGANTPSGFTARITTFNAFTGLSDNVNLSGATQAIQYNVIAFCCVPTNIAAVMVLLFGPAPVASDPASNRYVTTGALTAPGSHVPSIAMSRSVFLGTNRYSVKH